MIIQMTRRDRIKGFFRRQKPIPQQPIPQRFTDITSSVWREIIETTARNRARRIGRPFTCSEIAELLRCVDQQTMVRNATINAMVAKFEEIEGRLVN